MADWISGSGKPRVIIELSKQNGNVIASSVANPTVLTTLLPHKMLSGQRVRIIGHIGSTPSINDIPYTITVTGEKTFTIPVNVTVAGTGGMFEVLDAFYESTGTTTYTATSIAETGSPTYTRIFSGMRVLSYRTSGGLDYPTFAKVTAKQTGLLTVDAWTNGTPTNGKRFIADGWIADLPYCRTLQERFEQDDLVHEIFNGDAGTIDEVKHRGWKYYMRLDYSNYISADTLISMRDFLSAAKNDRLIVIPRIDKPELSYEVRFTEPVELSRFGKSPGYKDSVFSFKALENRPSFPIENNRAGYGTGYATNYGVNL